MVEGIPTPNPGISFSKNVGIAEENLKSRTLKTVHSYAIWNDVLEVGTAEKLLKIKTLLVHTNTFDSMFSEVGTAEKLFKTR